MKKLLMTGFDSFGENTVNPSWEAVRNLPEQVDEYMLCKLQIPTIFGKAADLILEKAKEFQPDLFMKMMERSVIHIQTFALQEQAQEELFQDLFITTRKMQKLQGVIARQQ